jgi:hypothetical protein
MAQSSDADTAKSPPHPASPASDAPPTPPANKKAAGLSALKTTIIQLGYPRTSPPSQFASLFHHFEVMDERPDTSRIGVHTDRGTIGGNRSRQLIFAQSAAREIAAYLDTRFSHSGAPYTALVVIRTLWLSDANNLMEDIVKDPEKYDQRTKIRLKAEIYAEKDGLYTPLFRFDSLQISLRRGLNTHFGNDLSDMLEDLADSSTILLAQKGGEGRKISRADILQFNQSRFDPLISRGGLLVKGAYMNFKEFKDNAPSLLDCEIKKEKDNLILYLRDGGGHSYYSHNTWGYCDGKTVYVMKDGMLVPAWREGKAWYILSQTQIEDPKKQGGEGPLLGAGPGPTVTSPAGATVMLGSTAATGAAVNGLRGPGTQKHIFTVDMDTGQLY